MAYELIKQFEGFRDTAYKCPAGVWTIGYGFTEYMDGVKVSEGDYMNQFTAESYLDYWVKNKIKLPKGDWNAEQTDALSSLIFNIGQGAFDKSTLKKALLNQDWNKAYEEWGKWTKAGGKELKGLVKRRNAERKKFFKSIILDIPF